MLVTYSEVVNATGREDGTFKLSDRGWIEPYTPEVGYAVALSPVFGENDDTASLSGGELIGTWTDLGTGELYVDRVVHLQGSITDALKVARAFNQAAIYDFEFQRVMLVDGSLV